jgi:hypothetical protein
VLNDQAQAPVSAPAPPAQPSPPPRPLRRTLLIAGLSCISATVISIWLVVPIIKRGHASVEYARGSLRAYVEAQEIYRRGNREGNGKPTYAHPFTKLGTGDLDGGGGRVPLIDSAFAAATSPDSPKHGYWFKDMETIGGKPIDWTKDFALCAMPARYGKTGWRVFIIKTDGTTWAKDLGRSDFVADFPADPAAAGWFVADG